MMRRGYDSDDSEFATAIAASAHAIHAIEEAISQVQIRKTTTRKQEAFRPPQAGSTSKTYSTKDTRNSSFVRPPGDQRQRETSRRLRAPYAKADAWEQAQIAKIRKWYDD